MKRLTTFATLVAFSLVLDRAYNQGEMAIRMVEALEDAQSWTVRSSGAVARSLYGYSRS